MGEEGGPWRSGLQQLHELLAIRHKGTQYRAGSGLLVSSRDKSGCLLSVLDEYRVLIGQYSINLVCQNFCIGGLLDSLVRPRLTVGIKRAVTLPQPAAVLI